MLLLFVRDRSVPTEEGRHQLHIEQVIQGAARRDLPAAQVSEREAGEDHRQRDVHKKVPRPLQLDGLVHQPVSVADELE